MSQSKENSEKKETTGSEFQKNIILWNDDVNMFAHVIECLMLICGNEFIQAQQCAHLVHHKGKCYVKKGDAETLTIMLNELMKNNLTVTME